MPLIPIPSFGQLKSAYDAVMKAIGFIQEVKEKFEVKVTGSSETVLYVPGKDTLVEKILNGTFPRIPGTYKVEINKVERAIEVATVSQDPFNVEWKFRDIDASVWWALPENDIDTIQWVELLKVTHN